MNDKENTKIDSVGLTLMFSQLRMPAIKNTWERFAEQADREGWPAGRLLWVLAELELAERGRRRIQRHLGEAVSWRERASRTSTSPWFPPYLPQG